MNEVGVLGMPADNQRRFFGTAAGDGIRGSLISQGSGTSTPTFEPYRDLPGSSTHGGVPPSPIAGRESFDISNATPFLGFSHRDSSAMQSMNSADAFNKDELELSEGGVAAKRDRVTGYAAAGGANAGQRRRKRMIIIGALVGLVVIGVGVGLGVALSKKGSSKNNSSGGGSGGGDGGGSGGGDGGGDGGGTTQQPIVSGGDGSTVTTDAGVNFTYANSFGGTWYFDQDDPFNMNAQAQSYVFLPFKTSILRASSF